MQGNTFHIPQQHLIILNNVHAFSYNVDATPSLFNQLSCAMFCCLILHRLFRCAILLLASAASFSVAQDACIYRSGATLVNSIVVVKQTIHIVTSVPHVTTFEVNTDLTVTVDNAPTSLDFLTTYFSRSTAIETINGSVFSCNELWITF